METRTISNTFLTREQIRDKSSPNTADIRALLLNINMDLNPVCDVTEYSS
jgi:hypothetical protein